MELYRFIHYIRGNFRTFELGLGRLYRTGKPPVSAVCRIVQHKPGRVDLRLHICHFKGKSLKFIKASPELLSLFHVVYCLIKSALGKPQGLSGNAQTSHIQ